MYIPHSFLAARRIRVLVDLNCHEVKERRAGWGHIGERLAQPCHQGQDRPKQRHAALRHPMLIGPKNFSLTIQG